MCEDYPRVAEQAKIAGWEFMGHAYDQLPIHKQDDQAAMIERSLAVIERFTGTRPVGWLGPGLTQISLIGSTPRVSTVRKSWR